MRRGNASFFCRLAEVVTRAVWASYIPNDGMCGGGVLSGASVEALGFSPANEAVLFPVASATVVLHRLPERLQPRESCDWFGAEPWPALPCDSSYEERTNFLRSESQANQG